MSQFFVRCLGALVLSMLNPPLASEVGMYAFHTQEVAESPTGIKVEVKGNHSRTLKIDASDLNISDDSIVRSISYTRSLSVSETLDIIKNAVLKSRTEESNTSVVIDLSDNTICSEGGADIGRGLNAIFQETEGIYLEMLDITSNRIADEGMAHLITALKPCLLKPEFTLLNIMGNYGANKVNVDRILDSFSAADAEILKGKIEY